MFVAVFAVYSFAAELFRRAEIPKRLIPATIALGSLTFTMDAAPGTPQIQNIIPSSFFGTTAWAAPLLGLAGSVLILVVGLLYLDRRRRALTGEGYGTDPVNEPVAPAADEALAYPALAILPLLIVGIANLVLTLSILTIVGDPTTLALGRG